MFDAVARISDWVLAQNGVQNFVPEHFEIKFRTINVYKKIFALYQDIRTAVIVKSVQKWA